MKRLTPYIGNKKALLPLSLVLSGIAAVLNILLFVLVWYITRDILSAPQSIDVANVSFYTWLAFASAIAGPGSRQADWKMMYRNPHSHYQSFHLTLNKIELKPDAIFLEIGCGGGVCWIWP